MRTRIGVSSGQGSDCSARCASTAAESASVAPRKTAKKLPSSPLPFNTTPPFASGAALSRWSGRPHRLHEVRDVGVGVAAAVQLVDREPDLGLPVLRRAGGERLDDTLETVVDRVLAGHALVQLGDGGPASVAQEVARRLLLVEPPGA